jgi:hypothetical protein
MGSPNETVEKLILDKPVAVQGLVKRSIADDGGKFSFFMFR